MKKEFPKILLYNTLTRRKEEFQPGQTGHVSIYCCGITTNGACHVGHARAFVVFDVIFRILKSLGYKVHFVRNLTDIDDKVITRAHEKGITTIELAKENIHSFHEDAKALKLLEPTQEPRATEHIEEICELIQKLLKEEMAYEVNGEVFYSVKKFKDYGKLSSKKIDDLQAGARIEIGERKKDPLDFVLWKPSKEGEPSWKSPWGKGRPGWHIECSAMSQKYLGKTFDIHGGGLDLIFPHHENEIAQSEAAYHVPLAKYWVHNGLVYLGKDKMSKSEGNIVSVKEFLKRYGAEVLRFWVLTNHYRSPLGFTQTHIKDAIVGLERFYKTSILIDEMLDKLALNKEKNFQKPSVLEEGLLQDVQNLYPKFQKSLLDDFNTAAAIGYVFELIRRLNHYLLDKKLRESTLTETICRNADNVFSEISTLLGIFEEDPRSYLPRLYDLLLPESMTRDKVDELIEERNAARLAKNWSRADEIRKHLCDLKIVLEDAAEGTTWRVEV
ncbi:MAG: cysteine--tRNA ligase [Deltaproteobacteria bacterium]|nr:cysteine--tRNA ligase [Deltaproteobacteria bacterium]